jgi:hypothetical protein
VRAEDPAYAERALDCQDVPSPDVRCARDLSPGEDSRHRLVGRIEREKVARVLDDAEPGAGDRSGIDGPLVVAGPVAVSVEQDRRPVDVPVLRASGLPTPPVAHQRYERPIVAAPVADQVHLSGQRLRQRTLTVDSAFEDPPDDRVKA